MNPSDDATRVRFVVAEDHQKPRQVLVHIVEVTAAELDNPLTARVPVEELFALLSGEAPQAVDVPHP